MRNVPVVVFGLLGILATPSFICASDSDWYESPLSHDRIYDPLGAGAIYDPLNAGSPLGLFPDPEYTVPLGPGRSHTERQYQPMPLYQPPPVRPNRGMEPMRGLPPLRRGGGGY